MKNISTPIAAEIISSSQQFKASEIENFDKDEFSDILEQLDSIKITPSKKVLDQVISLAKEN